MVTEALSRRPITSFVAITFVFSWSIWFGVSQVVTDPNIQFLAQIPAGFGPMIAAAIMVSATDGSVREWVRDMAHWRVSPRWYLAALGLPVLFAGVESVVYALFVGPIDPTVLPQRLLVWISGFVVALVLTGGFEEPGWRGFMQPRLQRSYSAFSAAVVVGLVWTLWHLPLHVVLPALSDGFATTSLLSRVVTIPLAIVLAWLYNGTDGSVIIPMLFHAGWNSSQSLVLVPFPNGSGTAQPDAAVLWGARVVTVLVVVALLLIIYDYESLAPDDRHTLKSAFEG